jgi:hypothetical protein
VLVVRLVAEVAGVVEVVDRLTWDQDELAYGPLARLRIRKPRVAVAAFFELRRLSAVRQGYYCPSRSDPVRAVRPSLGAYW